MSAKIIYGMPASKYHSDVDGPRVSQSLATICCNQSALHAYQAHPLLGAKPYTYEPSEDDGSLIHSLVLEPESNSIEEIDESTILTKDGKIAKSPLATTEGKAMVAQALARGRVPVLSEKLGIMRYKAKALRSRLQDAGVEFCGDSEVVIYWEEETPSGTVRCRARLDHLIFTSSEAIIIDLKTTKDAHRRSVARAIWEYGYDIQQAAYNRAVTAVRPDLAGRVRMLFAFGELDKPYAVNPITLSGEYQRMGEARWERGRDRWTKCLIADSWTGYEGGVVEPPAYASAQEMGEP